MNRREQLAELQLALEGVVDQLTRAQRVALAGDHGVEGLQDQVEGALTGLAALRNQVRQRLMEELSRPAPPPSLRKKD